MQAGQDTAAAAGQVSKAVVARPAPARYDGFSKMPIDGVWRAGRAGEGGGWSPRVGIARV